MRPASHRLQESLRKLLEERGVDQNRIADILDSGYFLRNWVDPFSGKTWTTVSDLMYGNKQFSSSFEIDQFIAYVDGKHTFPALPEFVRYTARSREDIKAILSGERRAIYIANGQLSFRGQSRQHTFKRRIPNPVRSDSSGSEISLFPGIYRQRSEYYSFRQPVDEQVTIGDWIYELEPNNPQIFRDSLDSYDLRRCEQHYASQTSNLDITFDIDVAIFFATHRFESTANGTARYRRMQSGEHAGVIYCFCFRDPPVRKSQFLIENFDLFKTYRPERIVRQQCGLPLLGDYERNIALCDIDCIISLDRDFESVGGYDPMHLFPSADSDPFYARLLDIKARHPEELANVVEYDWARD